MYIDPLAPTPALVESTIGEQVKQIKDAPNLHNPDYILQKAVNLADTQHSPSPQFAEDFVPHTLGGFRGAFESLTGKPPTERDIWAGAIRSWRDLNEKPFKDLPTRVAAEHVDSLIEREEYTILTGTLVRCDLFLTNGHVVTGESRPVAQENFIHEEGKKRALAAARTEIFKLEAYVLRKKRFEAGLK